MPKATFTIDNPLNANPPESKVWFHVTVTDGRVTAVEEHTGYAGGPITGTLETLSERVAARGGSQDALAAFLMSLGVMGTVDRSGSMSKEMLRAISDEVKGIMANTDALDMLDFQIDGVLVRETNLDQFLTEVALRDWRRRVVQVWATISGKQNEFDDDRLDMLDQLDDLIGERITAMRQAAEARMMSIAPRRLDMVVVQQNDDRDAVMNWSMGGMKVSEIEGCLDAFERAEQMTSFEFDAYETFGQAACNAEGIETLHDLFGTRFAEAFFLRKKFLILDADRRDAVVEVALAQLRLDRIEAKITELMA
jgi:hypothetical protein